MSRYKKHGPPGHKRPANRPRCHNLPNFQPDISAFEAVSDSNNYDSIAMGMTGTGGQINVREKSILCTWKEVAEFVGTRDAGRTTT